MKLLKIGELAKESGVSPRTIDYYTNLGLIQPEKRSDTNYRLYSAETLGRLKRIDFLKKEKFSLEEIKETLEQWDRVSTEDRVSEKIAALQVHMLQLEREVSELKPMIERLRPAQTKHFFKYLTPQTAACIEALLLLLGNNTFM